MSQSEHTPGPWRAIAQGGSSTVIAPTMPPRNDRRSEVTYGYKEDGGYCVGYPFLYQAEPYKPDESTRMDFVCFSHADARLISAAPELLEALKDCTDRFVEAFPAAAGYGPILKARAAIAKATGQ